MSLESRRITGRLQALELLDPPVAQGESQGTHFIPVGLHLALLQFPEGGDGNHRQLDAIDSIPNLSAEAGSLGCGHHSHVVGPFQYQDVLASSLGQRVGAADTDSTAADDHHFRSLLGIHDEAIRLSNIVVALISSNDNSGSISERDREKELRDAGDLVDLFRGAQDDRE